MSALLNAKQERLANDRDKAHDPKGLPVLDGSLPGEIDSLLSLVVQVVCSLTACR